MTKQKATKQINFDILKNLAKQNDKNLQAILENETLRKIAITFGVAIANSNGMVLLRLPDEISQYFSEKYFSLVSLPTVYDRFANFLHLDKTCINQVLESEYDENVAKLIAPDEALTNLKSTYDKLTKAVRRNLTDELILQTENAESIADISKKTIVFASIESLDEMLEMIEDDFKSFLASSIPVIAALLKDNTLFLSFCDKVSEAGISSNFGFAVSALYTNPHLFLLGALGALKSSAR